MDSSVIMSALASAALEWLLILFLFLHAIFSYFVTKYASYFELQTPCLLCSRLDHLFGREKPGFYKNLICHTHKLEISSWIYCQDHEELTGDQCACTTCLLPLPGENKPPREKNKPCVGRLSQDLEFLVEDGYLVAEQGDGLHKSKLCPVCNSMHISRPTVNKSVQTNPVVDELEVKSNLMHDGCGHCQVGLGKRRDKTFGSSIGIQCTDPLSHIGYSELKIASESEPESDFSMSINDHNDENEIGPEPDKLKEVCSSNTAVPQSGPFQMNVSHEDHSTQSVHEKRRDHAPMCDHTVLGSEELFHMHGCPKISSPENFPANEAGMMEHNWYRDEEWHPPLLTAGFAEASKGVAEERSATLEITEFKQECGLSLASLDLQLKCSAFSSPMSHSASMDISETYKLVSSNKVGPSFTELPATKDFSNLDEAKYLFSWNDTSPRMQGLVNDMKAMEAFNSNALGSLPKRLSIERNESGFESLEGSVVSEIDGESAVDRLRRQIEHDKKSMIALYKDLEEERNASAIAANQAMAMINRLQEEKAAMQMEALQYQRMMEEQSEYDQEALQKANDLLSQREKELQDLEVEFENYKRRFENGTVEEKIFEPMSTSYETDSTFLSLMPPPEKSEKAQVYEGNMISLADLGCNFQQDKLYILKCLKKLEKKPQQLSEHEAHIEISEHDGSRCQFPAREDESTRVQEFSEEQISIYPEDMTYENGDSSQKQAFGVAKKCQCNYTEKASKNPLPFDPGKSLNDDREPDLVAMRNEISYLTQRLEVLEADKKILEHIINSLRNGDEGVQFIQEIASHLQELRRIGVRRKEATVS